MYSKWRGCGAVDAAREAMRGGRLRAVVVLWASGMHISVNWCTAGTAGGSAQVVFCKMGSSVAVAGAHLSFGSLLA